MTMAAAIESRTAEAPAWSKTSRIAGVEILHDLGQAETIWRGLEDQQQFSTPYQRFDFLSRLAAAGRRARRTLRPSSSSPMMRNAGRCCCCRSRCRHEHGVRTACFMGGKHATFNMALWDRDFAAERDRRPISMR